MTDDESSGSVKALIFYNDRHQSGENKASEISGKSWGCHIKFMMVL